MQLPISKEVSDEGDVSVVDASGDPWFEGTGFGTEGAAADLIVRAVNSHAALVESCKVLAQIVYTQNGNLHDDINQVLDMARAALAAAEAA